MSKIIEALENVRDAARGSLPTSSRHTPTAEKAPTSHQMTQQELADVYFSGSGKTKPAASPTVIRVIDKRQSYMLPWIITLATLALASLALFTTKRIAISVNFQDASVSAPVPEASRASGPQDQARILRLSPADFMSSVPMADGNGSKDILNVTNHGVSGGAYAASEFSPTFNATGYVLEFEAKGRSGGEALEVAFRDVRRQSSLNSAPLRPFPMGLTTRWEKARVIIDKTDSFDATRISQMRFEVGTQRTGNPPDTLVSIRNIRWVPRS